MAVNSATLQLVAAVSSLTFVLVTGIEGLLGLGPAIFLLSGAMTSAFAGTAGSLSSRSDSWLPRSALR